MLLNGGVYEGARIVSDSTVRLFTTRAAGNRALGWAMADGQWGSGRYLSDGSFGHVGFTGTSIWIDPGRELFVILLTNRVYKPRVRGSSKAIADIRADLADAAAVAVTDDPEQILAMPTSFRSELRHGWNPRARRRHVAHRRTRHAPASGAAHATGASPAIPTSKGATKAKAVASTTSN
jgi:serine-type D-Ala-D-Ala carboxypeptidase